VDFNDGEGQRPSVWAGTAASREELPLPPGSWLDVQVRSIWVSPTKIVVVGHALNDAAQQAEALLWTRPIPPCTADFNGVGGVSVQDVFDFLADWSSQVTGGPIIIASADFNGVGGVSVQDIFDFLAAWNAGCP
jgi:hypothetical protein